MSDLSTPTENVARLLDQFEATPLSDLLAQACALREEGHGRVVSYSRKVFIPLTRLCRDVCGYCTFATSPRRSSAAYLSPDEVLAIARAGRAAGCKEALFTLGDKPELRYAAARDALRALGFASTHAYLAHVCKLVLDETGLLPHVNAGVMTESEVADLRAVSVSQGIMLESVSARLCEPGGPHYGSPDKDPAVRLAMIEAAGRQQVPFTTGILIGIGETRRERIESLLALRALHAHHGHIQEIIIQNFRAKAGTRMARTAEPSFEDLLWTAAVARLIFGPAMNIQVPPNLSFGDFPRLLTAGINDWGGISPVTADHVNPEAPWPQLDVLDRATAQAGHTLTERLAIYPAYARTPRRWLHPDLARKMLVEADASGFARCDAWSPGSGIALPARPSAAASSTGRITNLIDRGLRGERLGEDDIVRLFDARGCDVDEIAAAADQLRARTNGDVVTYAVNRNINYTNVCTFACRFCAFSKGKASDHLRGRPYDLALDEVARRVTEAWERGATEVCMQGGIHPHYTGETYLSLLRTAKDAVPGMHVHAFSPLEVTHGASTLGLPVPAFLEKLQRAGLGSLPGTAAEILDDDVRAIICPDKLTSQEWLDVIEAAHRIGLPTTATIMFGHVEEPRSWARHLLRLRDLQERTGGFTEFVPLPFVHMEAPMFLKGGARKGPTWRETLLMHALARLVLNPLIRNIQASWVKLGADGVSRLLAAGVNDLGGTLMNESISRAAGTQHGQEMPPARMEELIRSCSRTPHQRTTRYGVVDDERRRLSFEAQALQEIVQTPVQASRQAFRIRAAFPLRHDRPHQGIHALIKLGYKASAEQFAPRELLSFACLADELGFDSVFISDHFQPWKHTDGHAPFALSWLGALGARTRHIVMGTSVLTPTFRYHPSLVAQAFGTLGQLFPGRIILGVGTGESLNEVPATGMAWPEFKERFTRLREALTLIRRLWSEERVSSAGEFYKTENATIYDRPERPLPIYIAAAGPLMAKYVGRAGDGFICTSGKAPELYRETLLPNVEAGLQAAGRLSSDIDRMIEMKVSFDTDLARAREDTRHWAALALSPEEKMSVEDPLAMEKLADALPVERTAKRWIVSSDPDEHVEKIAAYVDLGFRHLVFHAPGPDQERFLRLYSRDVLPRLRARFG